MEQPTPSSPSSRVTMQRNRLFKELIAAKPARIDVHAGVKAAEPVDRLVPAGS